MGMKHVISIYMKAFLEFGVTPDAIEITEIEGETQISLIINGVKSIWWYSNTPDAITLKQARKLARML